MQPVGFEGATEVSKPENMTDEQCMSLWAKHGFGKLFLLPKQSDGVIISVVPGVDVDEYPYYISAWKPSYEDLQALNRGEPVYVKTLSRQLPPMALFTLDENNQGNF
jgi:hypothetical protein